MPATLAVAGAMPLSWLDRLRPNRLVRKSAISSTGVGRPQADVALVEADGSTLPEGEFNPAQTKKPKKFPNWTALTESNSSLWAEALRSAKDGPRVLFATAVGGHPQFTFIESALSIALTLRGAVADSMVCDGLLPACLRAKVSKPEPSALVDYRIGELSCPDCIAKARKVFNIPGLRRLEMTALTNPAERALARQIADTLPAHEIASYESDGAPLGEHARAGALRYYGVGDLSGEPEGELVLRRYFEASLLTAFATRRALAQGAYDVVVTNHGIYTPHGVINEVALRQGVRTVTWHTAYRRQCAIFSHRETYHHTLMNEPTSAWEDMPWSEAHEAEIMSYLHSRRYGDRDWIYFNRTPDEDVDRYAKDIGIDLSKPLIGMLTNVVWDAQLHYPANAFPSMLDWMTKTVAYFKGRPELQLVIRIHPGELAPPGGVTKSRQPAEDEIRRAFPDLPTNIFIVSADNKLSTYSLMEKCNAVIIYGTKMGVELTSLGIPVVVAGEAWIRNKGVTTDASNEVDYFAILDRLPGPTKLSEEITQRARKYAYHFFFRRMVPLPFLKYKHDQWPPFMVKLGKLEGLSQGRIPGLDVLCDGILSGSPFIYEAEHLGLHDS